MTFVEYLRERNPKISKEYEKYRKEYCKMQMPFLKKLTIIMSVLMVILVLISLSLEPLLFIFTVIFGGVFAILVLLLGFLGHYSKIINTEIS